MRRWAIVVVVEAETADDAMRQVRDDMVEGAEDSPCIYVGDACRMSPADEYETEQIRLLADGEIAYTVPEPPKGPEPEAGDMSRTDGLGAERGGPSS